VRDANSEPLSTWITAGFRCDLDSRLSTSITSWAESDPCASVASASRVYVYLVHHGQHAKPSAVMQLVVHEIHAPPLVPAHRRNRWTALHHRLSTPRSIPPQIQALQAIETLRALVVDQPALASQQHVDPW
jgi:hypothetical protein